MNSKTISVAEFSTAYPAPHPFASGQCSPFTGAEVKGLSLEAKAATLEAEKPNSPSRQRQQW